MLRNPEKMNNIKIVDDKYRKGFDKLQLLDSLGNLKLSTWEKISKETDTTIIINSNNYFLRAQMDTAGYKFEVIDNNKNIITTKSFKFSFLPGISYCIFDLDEDGKEDILVLDNWYIINGDNYDFTIISINKN